MTDGTGNERFALGMSILVRLLHLGLVFPSNFASGFEVLELKRILHRPEIKVLKFKSANKVWKRQLATAGSKGSASLRSGCLSSKLELLSSYLQPSNITQ